MTASADTDESQVPLHDRPLLLAGVTASAAVFHGDGLGAVWRGIGPPELAGISSTPADTPSARALRLVRWVVCWPRFKINRLAVGGRRGKSGRAT